MKFSLVIPAYNEKKNLPTLMRTVIEASNKAKLDSSQFNLILVDNGSTDGSYEIILKIIKNNQWQDFIRVVKVDRNQGYGYGIMAGLQNADGDILGWTHADLQCDPENVFKALQIYLIQENKMSLVKGHRLGRNYPERFVSWVFARLATTILGLSVKEINAQPKIFPRELLQHLRRPPHNFTLDIYLLFWAQKMGYQILSFNVLFPPRTHGVSHWADNFSSRYRTMFHTFLYMCKLAKEEGKMES